MVILKKAMKLHFRLVIKIFFLSFISFQNLVGQNGPELFEKGKIIDTVRCAGNPKYTYALYLPKKYSENAKWPIIYIFDPGARGKTGLTCFIQAAEEYGYIAVCSNNSKNFLSGTELEEIINYLFTDTEARFSIDPGMIYTSGFSGGSRVASLIAFVNRNISGVIACGAGFPNYSGFNKNLSFNYYGLVGNRDMNYLEMYDLEEKLDSVGMTVELRIFNGSHDWPATDLIEEAVGWMELKAMQTGIKYKNPVFMNSMFEKYRKRAALLTEKGNLSESVHSLKNIIRDFPEQSADLHLQEKLDSLRMTKEYCKSLRSGNKDRLWEREKQNSLLEDLNMRVRAAVLPDSILNWWTGQIRVLMLVNVVSLETGRNYFNIKKYKAALICYRLASLINPENKNIHFMLAKIYALDNEPGESLRSLEKAIKLGYNNMQSIEKDSAFIKLQNEKRYIEVMNKLR
jgi:hypothetical protein